MDWEDPGTETQGGGGLKDSAVEAATENDGRWDTSAPGSSVPPAAELVGGI